MTRAAPPLQLLAAAVVADTSAASAFSMSARSSYTSYRGGGRNQRGRGFSTDGHDGRGRGYRQFVTGDSHFRSVRDANSEFRQRGGGGGRERGGYRGGGAYYPRQRPPPQQPPPNPNPQFRPQFPPSYQNANNPQKQPFPPLQFSRPPPPPRGWDYRKWEYAKTAAPPPPNSERFIVLSYNILADYLASTHRSKLYYHIPRHMLDWEWRRRSIIFELSWWSPDIICFQEVDRFYDLEEELKKQGFAGIWKMRTGNAIDGCAVFWRASRFKLLYEESIEFNKHGLRDNVAQICVLELNGQNTSASTSALHASSVGSKRVIICNIHVLYNPKRGEIKLGQIRMLLERADAVSKTWDDAPVVLCGDFNCTPKSPLYNFISEQKLDLSGLDRDKVSGQASAEIPETRPNNLSNNPPDPRTESFNSLADALLNIANKLDDSLSDTQSPQKDGWNIPSTSNHFQPLNAGNMLGGSTGDVSCTLVLSQSGGDAVCFEEAKETKQSLQDDEINDEVQKSTSSVTSYTEGLCFDVNKMEKGEEVASAASSFAEELSPEQTNYYSKMTEDFDNLECTPESLTMTENLADLSPRPVTDDVYPATKYQGNISSATIAIDYVRDEELEGAFPQEQNGFPLEVGLRGEDEGTFLSELHGKPQPGFDSALRSNLNHSPEEFVSEAKDCGSNSPGNEVMEDLSLGLEPDAAETEKTAYDPSLWTPMEIATATGSAECMFLEHSLKLKSTYSEVEDTSRTRDPNGEPLVTSYNRRFLGTVDYIWRSEGLQTLRVLAPIPKDAMKWTLGFPTKKWGSDHIALASELTLTKDLRDASVDP